MVLLSADRVGHLMLLRQYVSRKAAGKGRAVLESLGLDSARIETCFSSNPMNEEGAVQTGLLQWIEGKGLPATWKILLDALENANIAHHHIRLLKKELGMLVCVCLYLCARVHVCAHACVHIRA